ncbi:Arc family DNA-binding protein [Bacillus badius]|uniref:Arc family DNA-binding protein n=1 Tax=Bacillus badius TaxID=1455 RepID=UPI001CBC33D2|nr:Arc family DNA-binding protein [Bacillus badius]UAT29462.1 Arc family DNA-binding protein [Bacillus badius]
MTDRKRFTLRMDAELFERIEKLAEKNKRSIAKEIEYLLDQHLAEEDSNDTKKD